MTIHHSLKKLCGNADHCLLKNRVYNDLKDINEVFVTKLYYIGPVESKFVVSYKLPRPHQGLGVQYCSVPGRPSHGRQYRRYRYFFAVSGIGDTLGPILDNIYKKAQNYKEKAKNLIFCRSCSLFFLTFHFFD